MTTNPAKKQPVPFGKYLLMDRINIGGMAEVWRGKMFGAGGFERLVAIKRILPNIAEDEEFISMFIDEAKISVQLTHANIAQIYELGQIASSYFIAMEYIPGRDLRAIFDRARKRGEPAPIPLVCYVVAKMCEGLDYAHRKKDGMGRDINIVHRDISPQNILVSFEGEVKVIDFGIAKAAGKATKTQAGILKGKFGYMSPEQIRGLPLDRRSDVFAIGVCLYELLTGERLFVGDSDFSVLEKVRKAEVLPPSTYNRRITPELEKIVLKALTKDVEDRYQYANELADDLQRFLITSDSIFSRKDLMQYMKSTFAEDVEREKVRLQEYSEVRPPPGMAAAIEAGFGGAPVQASQIPSSAPAPAPVPQHTPTAISPVRPLGEGEQPPTDGAVRRSASLVAMPRLTAAAPMLGNVTEEENAATAIVSSEQLKAMDDGAGVGDTQPGDRQNDALHQVRGEMRHERVTEPERSAVPRPAGMSGPPPEVERTAVAVPKSIPSLQPASVGRRETPPLGAASPPAQGQPPVILPSAKPDAGRPQQSPTLVSPPNRIPQQVREVDRRPPPPPVSAPVQVGRAPEPSPGPLAALLALPKPVLYGGVGGAGLLLLALIAFLAFRGGPPEKFLIIDLPPDASAAREKARVILDGKELGVPPSWPFLHKTAPGKHLVVVSADGYGTFSESVDVSEDRDMTTVVARIQRAVTDAQLMIVTLPESATIFVDGFKVEKKGSFYLGKIPVGDEHTIRVEHPGYAPYEKTVSAKDPSDQVQLTATLSALEHRVRVDSQPDGAAVFLNGRELGSTPVSVKVPGGTGSLTLRKKCYDDEELPLSLPENPSSDELQRSVELVKQPDCR